ncbi:MAG: hypothetical protein JWN40_4434 [Phycisphaerales bacterium]|nr:hypothetical protein [Phycisphaerales bacterium]
MEHLSNALSILMLVIGFGFVIFWHELGHFLAAKWVGIKVEQFAVGMGHAVVSFRKGIGWKLGNTRAEYDKRVIAHLDKQHPQAIELKEKLEYTDAQKDRAAAEIGLGETEYRLSWIPIGGYVKMLGQDDMKASADAEDPRAFNKKTIPQRMLVVSAGVIMNIILAALLFMGLFMMGFHAPAPVVGNIYAGSPAQQAGLEVGDKILSFNGQPQQDFTKISLNTALASADEPIRMMVERVRTGKIETIDVQPTRPEGASKAFLALGIGPSPALEGLKQRDWPEAPASPDLELSGLRTIRPGDVITQVNGTDVKPDQFYVLDEAVQKSGGKPVPITVKRQDGKIEIVAIVPRFESSPLTSVPFNIAGLQPRMRVEHIASKDSPVFNKMKPGDVIKSVVVRNPNTPSSQPGDAAPDVSLPGFIKSVGEAGQKDQTIDFVVVRDGKDVEIKEIKASVNLDKGRKGVGVAPGYEDQTPVVGAVLKKSPADNVKDGIPLGSLITAVDATPVKTWFDVRSALQAKAGEHTLTLLPVGSEKPIERTLALGENEVKTVASIRLGTSLFLNELITIRKTTSPATAMGWGVLETRDLILQFYVTLQRMFGGTVSASNLMGPLGIVQAGSRFAFKGNDWLVWFLAMISANLAVVNFLPIPIVDGGLFLFLIIEKIQGKPLSPKARDAAQLVGLALILSVFLMVTYNDIARMFGH